MSLFLVGVGCVLLGVCAGIACTLVALHLFQPVLDKYISVMSLNVRLNEENIAKRVSTRLQIPIVQNEKQPRKGVFKPRNDADKDVT